MARDSKLPELQLFHFSEHFFLEVGIEERKGVSLETHPAVCCV